MTGTTSNAPSRTPASAAAAAAAASVPASVADEVGPDHTRWLMERNRAFDEFRAGCRHAPVVTEHQETLKAQYAQAKQLATEVNTTRDRINELKEQIAQLRVESAAQGLVGA